EVRIDRRVEIQDVVVKAARGVERRSGTAQDAKPDEPKHRKECQPRRHGLDVHGHQRSGLAPKVFLAATPSKLEARIGMGPRYTHLHFFLTQYSRRIKPDQPLLSPALSPPFTGGAGESSG